MARVTKSSTTLERRAKVLSWGLGGSCGILLLLYVATKSGTWVILALIAMALLRRYDSTFSGVAGERRVSVLLASQPADWTILNDISLVIASGRAQIDHIAVTPSGLILFETKNHGGRITSKGRDWVQHLGRNRYRFYSPINQALGHERVMREFLSERGLGEVPIKSYVVFARASVELFVPRDLLGVSVRTLDELRETMAPNAAGGSLEHVDRIVDSLLDADQPPQTLLDVLAHKLIRDRQSAVRG